MNNKRDKFKSFLKILFGSAGGQLILLCSLPFLSRFYGPGQFADYAIVFSITNILGVVISFRLENAIFSNAGLRRRFAFTLAVVVAFISAFIIIVMVLVLAAVISLPGNLIIWGVVGALGFSLFNTSCFMLNSSSRYNEIAILRIGRPVVEVLAALAFIKFSGTYFLVIPLSYVLVMILSVMVFSLHQYILLCPSALLLTFQRNKGCLLFDTPASLCVAFSSYAPFLILGIYFDKALLGMYSLAFRVVLGPVNTILQSVSYLSRLDLSESFRKQALMDSFVQWRLRLFYLGAAILLPVIGACYFELFGLTFGHEWEGVDRLILLLTPLIMAKIIAVPLSFVFIVKKELKRNLNIQLMGVGFTTLSLVVSAGVGLDFHTTLIVYSVSYALFYLVYFKLSKNLANYGK